MFGYEWSVSVTHNKNEKGEGSFTWSEREIKINDPWGQAEAIFLHEMIEAILVENLVRYYGQEGNTEYHFFFNHTQFTKIVADIFQALKDNKLI